MAYKNVCETLQKKIQELEKEIKIHKIAAKKLEESEKTYRHIFEYSPIMAYRSDYNGLLLDVNRAGADILGYKKRSDMIGLDFPRFVYADPADRNRFQKNVNKTGFVRDFETQFRRKNGSIIDVQLTATAHRNKKGVIDGYEGFILDITSRKQVARALLESEKKYRTVVENSLAAIFIHQKKRFCYVNHRFAEMLGYDSPEEIVGKPFWVIVHPEDRPLVKERGLKREKNDFPPDHYPFRAIKKDGSIIWAELRAAHATYLGLSAVIGNFIDITQRKLAEEEIRRLPQKLIEEGEKERKRIAADIHDEFGQSLTTLHFDLETLQKSLSGNLKEERKKCNGLITKVENLADVVRKTTSYLRPDLLDHLGLIPALEWYINEFNERQPGINIEFEARGFKKRLNTEIEIVLYRICQECLVNVKKHAQASLVNILLTYSYPLVIFIIKDNGIGYQQSAGGLPKNMKSRGIGLLSMRERVTFLRGNIDITSAPGKGTNIRIELPLT
jgi:PAS domain S-box-containing protein